MGSYLTSFAFRKLKQEHVQVFLVCKAILNSLSHLMVSQLKALKERKEGKREKRTGKKKRERERGRRNRELGM